MSARDSLPASPQDDTPAEESNLAAALAYASGGWPVFPLHTPTAGGCSCGNPKCEHVGKHPRTKNGLHDATTDAVTIRQWWTQWPDANIGIATGAASGLVGLDVDPRHSGDETLANWERQHGPLPHTIESCTGGGGRHVLFAHPGGDVKSHNVAPGIDVKADGGYIVAPPSLHASGRRYAWEVSSHPEDTQLAPLPEWLLTIVVSPATEPKPAPSETATKIRKGERNSALTSLAGAMRRRGMSEEAIRAALLAENEQRCDPPLSEDEVRVIARSVGRYRPETASAPGNAPEGGDLPTTTPWPEPLAPEGFHGLAGELVAMLDPHTEADPVAVLLSFFVAFGGVVGRGPHFVADAAAHYTNLFAVLVGRTAKGRKGSSQAQVQRLLRTVDSDWALDRIQYGLSSGEGLIWAVRDPIAKHQPVREDNRVVDYEDVVEDPGVTDKRLLLVEPEFASTLRVMGRDGNTLSATIRQAWETGDLRILTKNSPGKATGAHISIIGHITRDEVLRHLDTTEAANGFANRFLWVCVKRSKLLPDGGRTDQVDFASFTRRLREAVDFARTVREMERDDDARDLWHQVYPQLSQEVPGLLGAVIGRAEPQAMRLACLYALLDQSPVVQREHLEAALAVWTYCEASARFIFGDTLGDPTADTILRALRQATNGLTRTEISDLFGRNRRASDISRALGRLLEAGLAICLPDAATGGRPAERWYAVRPGQQAYSQTTKETNETN